MSDAEAAAARGRASNPTVTARKSLSNHAFSLCGIRVVFLRLTLGGRRRSFVLDGRPRGWSVELLREVYEPVVSTVDAAGLDVSGALVQANVRRRALSSEEPKFSDIRERRLGFAQQETPDTLALTIRGDGEPAEVDCCATAVQANGTDQSAIVAHAEGEDIQIS